MIRNFIFKTRADYTEAYTNSVESVLNTPDIEEEIYSEKNTGDYDFFVSVYTSLLKQRDLHGYIIEPIMEAALRMGFMMGRSYGVAVPEDFLETPVPRRSRRTKRKTTSKTEAPKEGASNEG